MSHPHVVKKKISVDINAKLSVVRTVQEIKKDLSQINISKKVLNIPVGDVVEVDDSYVTSNFNIPTSFVRHTKKIGDEPDITIDYCVEDEDLKWMQKNAKLNQDLDASSFLTIDVFEKIIIFLEKHTGFAVDPIPLLHAERQLGDKFKWPPAVTHRIMAEVYSYWMDKRRRSGKALCRKYWPQTPVSDTNPHHVFRPRDKERYRLRKQQRKNDVEAYRKMQQLRREFGRARELLQLVHERETLRETEITFQREIFELEVSELDENDDFKLKSKIDAYLPLQPPKLMFPHFFDTALDRRMVQASPTAGLKNRSDGKLIINLNKGLGNKGLHKLSSQTGLNLTGATTTAGVGSGIVDGWIDGGEEGGLKKKEKKRKRLGLLGNTSTAVLGIAEETVGGVGTGAVTGTAPTATILATPVLLPGLPGPTHYCQPSWPSFMYESDFREKINITRNYLTYLDELELRHPLHTPAYGIPGVSQNSSVFQIKSNTGYKQNSLLSSTTNANRTTTNQQQQQQQNGGNMKEKSNNNNTKSSIVSPATASNTMKTAWDLEAENDPIYDLYPRKYRCSGRIGRGGRIILDRKPIYETTGYGSISNNSTVPMPTENKRSTSTSSINGSNLSLYNQHNKSLMKPVTLTTTKWIHAGSLPPPIGPHRGLGTELLPNILTHTSHYNPSTGTSTTSQVHTGADSNQSVTGVPSIGSIRNTSFPVVVPMSYSLLPSSFMQREREIFCQSDSEDEAIEYIHPKKSKLSQDSIKTDIWKDNMNSKYCVSL